MERKVNIEGMGEESIENLAEQAGAKLTGVLQAAKDECDKILSRYGLELSLSYEILSKGINHNKE